MIISIASGKGGTGKTTVATNLALALGEVQFLDCDVEEPNAHIFLKPQIEEELGVYVKVPEVDEELCTHCGTCSELCEFNAIAVLPKKTMVFQNICHSCGLCAIACPQDAITEVERKIGTIEKGRANGIDFVHGRLNIGEPFAVPIVRAVKGELSDEKTVIIDAPPGTSCPVVSSLYGSDYCILVTEPTPFGLHDLGMMVEVVKEMGIKSGVMINRAGIGSAPIKEFCESEEVPILMEIPMERRIAELYSRGIPFVKPMPEWRSRFAELLEEIEKK